MGPPLMVFVEGRMIGLHIAGLDCWAAARLTFLVRSI